MGKGGKGAGQVPRDQQRMVLRVSSSCELSSGFMVDFPVLLKTKKLKKKLTVWKLNVWKTIPKIAFQSKHKYFFVLHLYIYAYFQF